MTLSLGRRLLVLTCLTLFVIAPSRASGQTAAWPGLSSSELQTVYLVDRSGAETTGKLVGLNPDSVVLLVDGTERRFDLPNVARLQKRDSLKNGTLIGAAVGIAMGLVAAGITDCPGEDPGGSCGGFRVVAFASSLGMYTAIGAGVDALVRGRTTLYTADTSSPARSSANRPPARMTLRVGVSW